MLQILALRNDHAKKSVSICPYHEYCVSCFCMCVCMASHAVYTIGSKMIYDINTYLFRSWLSFRDISPEVLYTCRYVDMCRYVSCTEYVGLVGSKVANEVLECKRSALEDPGIQDSQGSST